MREFASRASAERATSGSAASSRPCLKDSTAIREATSPACAPPIPSGTTNSGERASRESSLARRWRPVSVPAYCSATRSISVDLEREFTVADAHAVPGVQRPGRLEQLLVEIGAVGGVEILDYYYVALLVDARVPRRGKRILQSDLSAIAAAQHDIPVEVVDHPGVVAGGALDHQAGSSIGDIGTAERGGRIQAGGVGRRRPTFHSLVAGKRHVASTQILACATRNPQQEQVEHGDEAELQCHRYGRERRHPSSKMISVE